MLMLPVVSVQTLCNGDKDRPLVFQINDYHRNGCT